MPKRGSYKATRTPHRGSTTPDTEDQAWGTRQKYMAEVPEQPWLEHAACRGRPIEWWFSEWVNHAREPMPAGMRRALTKCFQCPVQRECLDWALRRPEPWGIWGGATAIDRRHRGPEDLELVLDKATARAHEHRLIHGGGVDGA